MLYGKQQVSGEAMMIAEYPQGRPSHKIRQGLALPVYTVALLLDYLSAGLGHLAAWIAGDDWP
jgi:hypothetical protein